MLQHKDRIITQFAEYKLITILVNVVETDAHHPLLSVLLEIDARTDAVFGINFDTLHASVFLGKEEERLFGTRLILTVEVIAIIGKKPFVIVVPKVVRFHAFRNVQYPLELPIESIYQYLVTGIEHEDFFCLIIYTHPIGEHEFFTTLTFPHKVMKVLSLTIEHKDTPFLHVIRNDETVGHGKIKTCYTIQEYFIGGFQTDVFHIGMLGHQQILFRIFLFKISYRKRTIVFFLLIRTGTKNYHA